MQNIPEDTTTPPTSKFSLVVLLGLIAAFLSRDLSGDALGIVTAWRDGGESPLSDADRAYVTIILSLDTPSRCARLREEIQQGMCR